MIFPLLIRIILCEFIIFYIFFILMNQIKNEDSILSLLNIEVYAGIIVTSIHYDYRYKSLRLIIINRNKYIPNMSCSLVYKNYIKKCIYRYKNYKYHNKPQGHMLISVLTKSHPNILVLNRVNIKVPLRIKNSIVYNISVCICKTVNYYAVKRVLQTIETYRYLGVDHFVIYKTNVSQEIENVFKYYQKRKIVDIVTWNITLEYKLKKYDYGQIFKTNDCLYRNMYNSKSLIITDWDEIILSSDYKNILEMINNRYNNKYNWFTFSSFLFHTEVYNGFFYDSNIPDTDIFLYREYCIFKKGCAVKNMYTYLKGINEVEVHFVYDGTNELKRVYVDTNYGYIRHTRRVKSFYYKTQCKTKWKIYPKNKEEDYISIRVERIQKELDLKLPSFTIHPLYKKLSNIT